jgi:hypothetical protein
LPTLLELFRASQNDAQRALLLRGCVRLLEADSRPAPEKVKIFSELLAGATRAAERKVILSGLATVPDPAALELVQPLLENADVRAEAKMAADKITAALNKAKAEAAKPKK